MMWRMAKMVKRGTDMVKKGTDMVKKGAEKFNPMRHKDKKA